MSMIISMAERRNLDFRKLLYRLGESLSRQDVDSLIFMCRDVIPVARMERVQSAVDLWEALSGAGKLTKSDLSYLSLLMDSIGRQNLLVDLQAHGFSVVAPVKNAEYMFHESLLKVAHNLSSIEVKELTYMFHELNSDKVFSATQMFLMLLQRQIISPTNLQPLCGGLEVIGRSDLTNYISHYLPSLPRNAAPQGQAPYRYPSVHCQDPSLIVDTRTPLSDVPGYQLGTFPSISSQESMSDDGGHASIEESQQGQYGGATTMVLEEKRRKHDAHLLRLLSVKEEELKHKEEEKECLQKQLTEQVQLGDRIMQEHNGECQAYSVNIRKVENLLMAKNQEVTGLMVELQQHKQQMGSIQGSSPIRVDDFYPLNRQPHGYCLIFNNYKFYHPNDESMADLYREGSKIDQDSLIQTFTYLKYQVVVKENHTATEMKDAIFKLATMDHSMFDSFVCCILTHGEADVVHGTDCQGVNLQQFAATVNLCPSLRGKPKIFFVQACRGQLEREGLDIQKDAGPPYGAKAPTVTATLPQDADFFFGYATPSGNAAYRSEKHGTWYITILCRVLFQCAHVDNLSSMMKKVNNEVSQAYTTAGFKQCPEYVDRLRKEVHFFHFLEKQ